MAVTVTVRLIVTVSWQCGILTAKLAIFHEKPITEVSLSDGALVAYRSHVREDQFVKPSL